MISISYAYCDSVCISRKPCECVCVRATTQNGETCEWTWTVCSHIQVFPISIATPCTHTHWRLRMLQCMVCRRTIKQNPTRWMMKTWKSFLCILYYTASLTVRHAFDSKMFRNVVNATWGSRKMMSTIELDVTAFDIRFSSKTQFVFGFLYNFNFVVCQMVWAVQI